MKENNLIFGKPIDISIVLRYNTNLEDKIIEIEQNELQVTHKTVIFKDLNIPDWFFKYKNWEYKIQK